MLATERIPIRRRQQRRHCSNGYDPGLEREECPLEWAVTEPPGTAKNRQESLVGPYRRGSRGFIFFSQRISGEESCAVLLVEQNLDFVRDTMQDFAILDTGPIVAQGGIDELIDELAHQHLSV